MFTETPFYSSAQAVTTGSAMGLVRPPVKSINAPPFAHRLNHLLLGKASPGWVSMSLYPVFCTRYSGKIPEREHGARKAARNQRGRTP
jgi:hypothetical protein